MFMIFNDSLIEFSDIFTSLLNLFNIYEIMFSYSNHTKIAQNLIISPNYFFYHAIIYICIFAIGFLILSGFVHMFREAISFEIKTEDNEMINRLSDLQDNLEKLSIKKRDNSLFSYNISKQVIWLCLSGSADLYNERLYKFAQNGGNLEDNKFLTFNFSGQIISFFKYLFAIKPKMQFKKLEENFAILIELKNSEESVNNFRHFNNNSNSSFEQNKNIPTKQELEEVYSLFDWLTFAGCRIPMAIYTEFILDKNLRMNMKNNYNSLSFLHEKQELDEFLHLKVDPVSYVNTLSNKSISTRNTNKNKMNIDLFKESSKKKFPKKLESVKENSQDHDPDMTDDKESSANLAKNEENKHGAYIINNPFNSEKIGFKKNYNIDLIKGKAFFSPQKVHKNPIIISEPESSDKTSLYSCKIDD